jgi:hypothetical protein
MLIVDTTFAKGCGTKMPLLWALYQGMAKAMP